MSLVGSLEDLGLGDILQIVSLARKSGMLFLRSDSGDGRIVFEAGLVRAAYVKNAPETLAGLLSAGGFCEPAPIDRIVAQCVENGSGRDERDAKVAEACGLSLERLQSLCREHVEQAVFAMFGWRAGEFSFDVCDDLDERFGELELPVGINAQYLTMEATRLGDEGAASDASGEDDFALSGEGDFTIPDETPDPDSTGSVAAHELVAVSAAVSAAGDGLESEPFAAPEISPAFDPVAAAESLDASSAEGVTDALLDDDVLAGVDPLGVPAAAESLDDDAVDPVGNSVAEDSGTQDVETPESPPAAAPPGTAGMPLVVIDAELMALEWLKLRLAPLFTRIHIFQHSEGGVARIRQYLGRGILPVVLVSSHVPADSLTGAREAGELVRRLRAQAPRMPLLAMFDGEEDEPAQGLDAADAVLVRPSLRLLADDRRRAETERMADQLRRALAPWSMLAEEAPTGADAAPADARQRAVSQALRDPASQGEVLERVIDFAATCFNRVALFMVREDEAIGIAERRLGDAAGPSGSDFARVHMGVRDSAWFRAAIDTAGSCCAAPSDAGDEALAALLGSSAPEEAVVGSIWSGGHLAALIYADNLPSRSACGDVEALDVVLREAGQALDRALRERHSDPSGA